MKDEINRSEKRYTFAELIDRGWTTRSISRYLPRPRIERSCSKVYGPYSTRYWPQSVVEAVQSNPDVQKHLNLLARRRADNRAVMPKVSLVDAVQAAGRSAHHWQERANHAWQLGNSQCRAARCTYRSIELNGLKERGIMALHRQGKLRYMGASALGMGLYEFIERPEEFLHSRLHPVGAKQRRLPFRTEVTSMSNGARECGGEFARRLLITLPKDLTGYVRSHVPAHIRERDSSSCWICGVLGHPAPDCWTVASSRGEVAPGDPYWRSWEHRIAR